MTRALMPPLCVALLSCLVAGISVSCASTDPLHHSSVPVFTKGTPLPPPELPEGWSMGSAVTREGMAKTTAMLDTPGLANLRETHAANANRLRFFKLARDAAGRWTANDAADLNDPNVEEFWFDPKERRVGPAIEANIYCHGIDPSRRATVGYKACTSNLAAPYDEGNRYWVNMNEHAIGEALTQAAIFPRLEAEAVAWREEVAARTQAEQAAAVDREKQDRLAEAERVKQRERERAALQLVAEHFRQSLAVGAETHCGMVIEVKRPIVKVQTMDGEKWLRLEQIYPAHTAPCRFFNHVYQDP